VGHRSFKGKFQLTFRVAEPEGLARRLPPLANGVTDQGLGGRSEATGAGNPVLCDVGFFLNLRAEFVTYSGPDAA